MTALIVGLAILGMMCAGGIFGAVVRRHDARKAIEARPACYICGTIDGIHTLIPPLMLCTTCSAAVDLEMILTLSPYQELEEKPKALLDDPQPGNSVRPKQGALNPMTGTPLFNSGRPTGPRPEANDAGMIRVLDLWFPVKQLKAASHGVSLVDLRWAAARDRGMIPRRCRPSVYRADGSFREMTDAEIQEYSLTGKVPS